MQVDGSGISTQVWQATVVLLLKKAETELEPQPLANKQASVADKWTLQESPVEKRPIMSGLSDDEKQDFRFTSLAFVPLGGRSKKARRQGETVSAKRNVEIRSACLHATRP